MHRDSNPTFQEQALDLEFVHCYGSHLDWLTNWFQRRLSCNGLAYELAQDVFVRLYEQRQRMPLIREPKAWLTTVAHGLLVNHYRRADLEKAYLAAIASLPSGYAPSPEQKAMLLETLIELDGCLANLPCKARKAFLMAQLEGEKLQDIALELGISLSMVKKYMAQAQQCFKEYEQGATSLGKISPEQRVLSSRALAVMPNVSRRTLLKSLAVLFGTSGLFYSYRRSDYSADWVSAKGEIQTHTLPDGSEMTLDSDTAVDLAFTATQKLIVLRRGRVMISTAGSFEALHLKPMVQTREGYALALGTVFSVEQKTRSTKIEVFEHRVQWQPLKPGATSVLKAGEQAEFDQNGVVSQTTLFREQAAWVQGLYVANSVPLKIWAAEVSRYRHAQIHCDAAIENWLVSGTFPLNKPDVALSALQDALPVQLIKQNTLKASPVLLVARDRLN